MAILQLCLDIAAIIGLGVLLYHLVRSPRAGAPFIPTIGIQRMVRLAAIRRDDVVFELGCGDGRFCVAAAKANAAKVVGYDISWLLVGAARLRARMSGMADRCTFEVQNIRTCDPSQATLVYLYLMPEITNSLATGPLLRLKPGARVLSSSFPIHEQNPNFRLLKQEKAGLSLAYLYERI